nr:retrovirus-related Pol polyprotein from transposon TNT 1-94 [Tanacetum cinerariifolium]
MPKEKKLNLKRTARISVHPRCYSNPHPVSPPYHPLSPPTNYQMTPPSTPNSSPPHYSPTLSLIISSGISRSKLLLTSKSTPPPMTSPPLALTQPSKHSSPLAINIDPIKLLFSTPPTSPEALFDTLEDLSPTTTNPPPPRPSFDSIERLTNEPPPLLAMEPPLPPLPLQLLTFPQNHPSKLSPLPPLGPNNPFPLLTHKMFCYSSKNSVRKFLRALHPKWRAKVTTIEESKDLTDEECLTFGSENEEYALAVRDFKKFFKRIGRFVRQPQNDKKTFQRSRDEKNGKSDRKCFKCDNPNHLIGEFPKPSKDKNQRAFVGCSWSDSDEEDHEKLKEEALKLTKFEKSTHCLNELLNNQKPFDDKSGLGFNSFEASSSGTKEIKYVKAHKKESSDGGSINTGGPLNMQATSKEIMGPPPVVTPGSEKRKICDNKCRVTFFEHDSEITEDGKVIGHANMHLIQSLVPKELVRKLPKLKFDQHFCDACKIGKQAYASHKAKNIVSMTRCLELLHMDLFGPSIVRSYGGNRCTLVIVDDYSRKVEELLNMTFDETPPPPKTSPLVDDDLDEEEAIKVTEKKNLENDIEDETLKIDKIVNIKK